MKTATYGPLVVKMEGAVFGSIEVNKHTCYTPSQSIEVIKEGRNACFHVLISAGIVYFPILLLDFSNRSTRRILRGDKGKYWSIASNNKE